MRKKILTILLCMVMVVAAVMPTAGAAGKIPVDVYVNGSKIDCTRQAYLDGSTTYVPIRDVSEALGAANVQWNRGTVTVYAEDLEITARQGQEYVAANGRYLYVKGGCRIENGSLMIPLRVLCDAFGAKIYWSNEEKAAYLITSGRPIESGESFYDSNDVYWLSRIIHAESNGESLEGKIAVGNVVLNRVESPVFPNSIYDVIFDCRYGIQFTPAYSGAVYCSPSAESAIAAKLALDGANTAGDSLYFIASYCASYSWAGRNRPFTGQIGNHCFYA